MESKDKIKMKQKALAVLLLFLLAQCLACKKKAAPPTAGPPRTDIRKPALVPDQARVIRTWPKNGSRNVDPARSKISVLFNKQMRDKSWSWAYADRRRFPQMTGKPYYIEGDKRNVLPAKLKPDHDYVIWINSARCKNFKDLKGRPARPFKFTFRTGKG